MYSDTVQAVSDVAVKKAAFLRTHPLGYMVAALMAGAYVGVGVFLAFVVGAPMADAHNPWKTALMGASFAVALSLVVFAGAELFTGNNMSMAVGWWQRRTTFGNMIAIWCLSWLGNFIGAALLAALLYYASSLNNPEALALVQKTADKKMHLSIAELIIRGTLCNWLVCLGVWCAYRMKSETGKLIMIFWCLYAFVAAGFEHSVANMTLLTLALLQPHAATVTVAGMGYNLLWVTLGNILGGALFVGGAYWLTTIKPREEDTDDTQASAESKVKIASN